MCVYPYRDYSRRRNRRSNPWSRNIVSRWRTIRDSGCWSRWTCWCTWRSRSSRWPTCRMRLARSAAGCRCLQDQWTGVVVVVVVVVVVGSFGVVASVASAAARFRPVHWFEQPRRGRRALDAPRDTGNTKERVKTTLLVSYWLSTCRRTTTLEKRLFRSCRLCSTISRPIRSTLVHMVHSVHVTR